LNNINLNFKYIVFLLFVLTITLLNTNYFPAIWEYYGHFGTLAAEFLTPVLVISKRGNIGGDGLAPLELSRYLTMWFGQSLFLMRVPVMLMGILAVVWTNQIFKGHFTSKILGFFAASTLFLNLYFQSFQHTAIILMISFSLSVALTLTSINLVKKFNIPNMILFLICSFFISHYYIFGRYLHVLVLISTIFFSAKKNNVEIKFWRNIHFTKLWIGYLSIFILLQRFCGKPSFKRFLNPRDYFFPGKSNIEVEFVSVDLLQTVIWNIKKFSQAFFGLEGTTHASNSIYVGGSLFIPYWPLIISIVILLGAIYWIINIIKHKKFNHFNLLILSWLIIGAILPLASKSYGPGHTTLSPFRVFFAIFPFTFFLVYGISLLKVKKIRYSVMSVSIFLQIYTLYKDSKIRNNYFKNFNNIQKIKDSLANLPPKQIESTSKYFFFYQYNWHLSESLKKFIIKNKSETTKIIHIDLKKLNENYTRPPGIHYIMHMNYQIPLISLYLGELGQEVNQIYFDNDDSNYNYISWTDFYAQSRNYPVSPDKHPEKIDKARFRIETNASYPVDLTRDYILYSDIELEVLKSHLDKNKISYQVLNFKYDKWH
jgi:hypothetical protein